MLDIWTSEMCFFFTICGTIKGQQKTRGCKLTPEMFSSFVMPNIMQLVCILLGSILVHGVILVILQWTKITQVQSTLQRNVKTFIQVHMMVRRTTPIANSFVNYQQFQLQMFFFLSWLQKQKTYDYFRTEMFFK